MDKAAERKRDKFDALGEIAMLSKEIEALQGKQDLAATVAAQNGASSTEIADAHGTISRQTAYNRWVKRNQPKKPKAE